MFRSSMSVRGLAAIVAACVALCAGAASASAAPLAVVANHDLDAVTVVDTATGEVVGNPVPVGNGPASVAITPDGRDAYVANAFDESVSVVDLSTMKTVGPAIKVGGDPFGIAITPDGSRVYVTDLGPTVWVIDTRSGQVVGEIEVSGESVGVAIAPDGRFAYVTVGNDGVVEVIDTESMAVVGEPIEVEGHPSGVEFTPDGRTAYVVNRAKKEVSAIDTATGEFTSIPLEGGEEPRGIVVSPDGNRAFVVDLGSNSISVIDTATAPLSREIKLAAKPSEVAVSADGETLYVAEEVGAPGEATEEVQRFDVETGTVVGAKVKLPGESPAGIAIAPDQSPIAAFAVPRVTVGVPATFSGAASTDADGRIASYSWAFGDGGVGSGARVSHTYRAAGTYDATLSVVDEEGCGGEEVFTGRTAYCSGAAAAVHPVAVAAPPVALAPAQPVASPPSNDFRIRRIVHNRRNGTVRMRVRLPSAGSVLLFGRKVHAVTRKSKGVQAMWLTIHARVELAKRLKKILHARVRLRVTFTPNGGTPKTLHRAVTLQRAPRHRHHRH
jgi:YVTN family beta-propeller protein